jgi:hypothetical protein
VCIRAAVQQELGAMLGPTMPHVQFRKVGDIEVHCREALFAASPSTCCCFGDILQRIPPDALAQTKTLLHRHQRKAQSLIDAGHAAFMVNKVLGNKFVKAAKDIMLDITDPFCKDWNLVRDSDLLDKSYFVCESGVPGTQTSVLRGPCPIPSKSFFGTETWSQIGAAKRPRLCSIFFPQIRVCVGSGQDLAKRWFWR